jgi:hypothetical protein
MSSGEEAKCRCASAEAGLEELGRDADDGEVFWGLTTRLTGDGDRAMCCVVDEMTAGRDEKRGETSRNERNFARRACRGKTLGQRSWFWGESWGAKVSASSTEKVLPRAPGPSIVRTPQMLDSARISRYLPDLRLVRWHSLQCAGRTVLGTRGGREEEWERVGRNGSVPSGVWECYSTGRVPEAACARALAATSRACWTTPRPRMGHR